VKVEFDWVGHPFVDAGLTALLLLSRKETPKELEDSDIEKSIKFLSKTYCNDSWKSYLSGQLFPNSGVLMTNPSMYKNRTPENLYKNLETIYNIIPPLDVGEEKCVICGRRERLKILDSIGKSKIIGRHIFPLVGTGDMLNFFPSANSEGIDICASCIFLTQLMPLATYKLGNVMLFHCYPYEYNLELTKEAVDTARKSSLFSDGRTFRYAYNFFFRKISEISRDLKSGWKNVSVTMYHFNNFNQRQSIEITYFPSIVLEFVSDTETIDPRGWKNIVRNGWSDKKLSFEDLEKKKPNRVYDKLIKEESIIQYFYDSHNKKVNSEWRLLETYAIKVLGMKEGTLDFVKDLSDRIIETIEKEEDNRLKKIIRNLERADKLYQFQEFFIIIERLRIRFAIPNSLLTFDDVSSILLGYGEDLNVSWRTVKNLILFRLYERLHNRLISIKEDENEIEEEVEL